MKATETADQSHHPGLCSFTGPTRSAAAWATARAAFSISSRGIPAPQWRSVQLSHLLCGGKHPHLSHSFHPFGSSFSSGTSSTSRAASALEGTPELRDRLPQLPDLLPRQQAAEEARPMRSVHPEAAPSGVTQYALPGPPRPYQFPSRSRATSSRLGTA